MMVEIDICRLRPPEPPLFTSTSDASRKRIESIQRNSTVYQDYLKTCGGGNGTLPGLPQASSSTPAQTTIVSTPVTTLQYVTTEVTNITSSQNDTFLPPNISNLATSSSSDDWVVPVVVVVVVISILVIIVAVIVFLMKKHKERSGHELYDLQTHENVNYLNNKAEKGDKWGDPHETVNYLDNKAEKGEKWNGRNKINANDLDKGEDGKGGHRNGAEKREKNPHTPEKTRDKLENGKKVKNNEEITLKNGNTFIENSNPPVSHSKSSPKHSIRKMKDQEVIYANSQFEKVARADQSHNSADRKSQLASSLSFEMRDNTPPVDKKTHEMYYIDENPYDRVDRRERPVPKKRTKVLQQ